MSKFVEFNLPVITQKHSSGFTLSRVFGDFTTPWPGLQGRNLALAFQQAAQKKLIREGDYNTLLGYLNTLPYHQDSVAISVPANSQRFDDETHSIQFEMIYWEYEAEELFGFIPSLEVVNFGVGLAELKNNLKESVLLEFTRSKRLQSQQALIARQWFQPPVVEQQPIQLEFYTPAELAAFRRVDEEKIVEKTSRPIALTQRETHSLEGYVEELQRNILGAYRQSVLIVGPNGCGKTALLQAFFQLHRRDFKRTPWQTSAAQLLRVLTEEGGWQYGLGRWVTELRRSTDVMYVGNYAELFEVGQYAGNAISIGDALREPLQRNEITLIGELTEEQLEKIELRSPGYGQLFHIIRFSERTAVEENRITIQAVKSLGKSLGVMIDEAAIRRVVALHRRYAPYSGYPGKTIRFFESLMLRASKEQRSIDERDAINAFCDESGMPVFLVDASIPFKTDQARQFFAARVIGQRRAVEEVINGLLTVKMGMARSGKPITSALFVGPTGVGKTQIAKTLAEYMFGDARRMVRFDMSEYSDPYSVTRLTAANEASLVTKIRQQPFSIVLLDEIEKADASFFDLLLQVLDEGRLTDDKGEVANFCSTLVIMTSNIGAQAFSANPMGFSQADASEHLEAHFEEAVTQHFRPELFNRIDLVVPFSPLTGPEQEAVIKKEINDLKRSPGIAGRPVSITFSEALYPLLAQEITSSKYGARAVQRIIQQRLAWPLAEVLARYRQDDTVTVSVSCDESAVMIADELVQTEKKDNQSLLQVADSAAELRSDIKALEYGGTWITLLSQLDRLEAIKKRKKEKFWQDPKLVHNYERYRALCSRFDQLLQDAFLIEEQVLESLQEEDANLLIDEFSDMVSRTRFTLDELIISLNTMANPHHDNAFIFIYGTMADVPSVSRYYQQWFETLQLVFSVQYIHLLTGPAEEDEVAAGDDPAKVSDKPKMSDKPEEAEGATAEDSYVYLAAPSSKKHHQLVGQLLHLKGPAVGLYLTQEAGIWLIEVAEDDCYRVSVDLHLGNQDDYAVPQGIQRKKYYTGTKPTRKLKEGWYTDKRFLKGEAAPLSAHPARMQALRQQTLETTHLNRSFQVKAKASDRVPDRNDASEKSKS
ncbi:MAG: AAA family ATPase [Pseudomonadales bacterium]|nr:AAA family ATPase [Pseudomonadales bacterium]